MKRVTLILFLIGALFLLLYSCGIDQNDEVCSTNLSFPADYWFAEYNPAYFGSDPSGLTLAQIQENTDVQVTWGSITFNAPDAESGIGTYRLNGHLPFADGGTAIHDHNLAYWDSTDPGYIDGPDDAAEVGTFVLECTHITLAPPDGPEGYFTEDGSTLIMSEWSEGGATVFFVNKPQDFSSNDLSGKWILFGPYTQLEYASFGDNTRKTTEVGLMVMDLDVGNALGWQTEFEINNLTSISQPIEQTDWDTGIDASFFDIDPDGFSNIPVNEFFAFGSGGTMVAAGEAAEFNTEDFPVNPPQHKLNTLFGIRVHDSPTLAMVAGTWASFGTDYGVDENESGWGSGDEVPQLVHSYGTVSVAGNSFAIAISSQDAYTGSIEDVSRMADILGPYTEYMVIDEEVSTSPIASAIAVPLFHVTEPGNADSIIFRAAVSADENVMVMWSPMDEDNIPSNGGVSLDHVFIGAAVRTH
jgi:hypothetical protein